MNILTQKLNKSKFATHYKQLNKFKNSLQSLLDSDLETQIASYNKNLKDKDFYDLISKNNYLKTNNYYTPKETIILEDTEKYLAHSQIFKEYFDDFIDSKNSKKILNIQAKTGSGKTDFILKFFINLIMDQIIENKDIGSNLIFLVPTIALSQSVFETIKNIIKDNYKTFFETELSINHYKDFLKSVSSPKKNSITISTYDSFYKVINKYKKERKNFYKESNFLVKDEYHNLLNLFSKDTSFFFNKSYKENSLFFQKVINLTSTIPLFDYEKIYDPNGLNKQFTNKIFITKKDNPYFSKLSFLEHYRFKNDNPFHNYKKVKDTEKRIKIGITKALESVNNNKSFMLYNNNLKENNAIAKYLKKHYKGLVFNFNKESFESLSSQEKDFLQGQEINTQKPLIVIFTSKVSDGINFNHDFKNMLIFLDQRTNYNLFNIRQAIGRSRYCKPDIEFIATYKSFINSFGFMTRDDFNSLEYSDNLSRYSKNQGIYKKANLSQFETNLLKLNSNVKADEDDIIKTDFTRSHTLNLKILDSKLKALSSKLLVFLRTLYNLDIVVKEIEYKANIYKDFEIDITSELVDYSDFIDSLKAIENYYNLGDYEINYKNYHTTIKDLNLKVFFKLERNYKTFIQLLKITTQDLFSKENNRAKYLNISLEYIVKFLLLEIEKCDFKNEKTGVSSYLKIYNVKKILINLYAKFTKTDQIFKADIFEIKDFLNSYNFENKTQILNNLNLISIQFQKTLKPFLSQIFKDLIGLYQNDIKAFFRFLDKLGISYYKKKTKKKSIWFFDY